MRLRSGKKCFCGGVPGHQLAEDGAVGLDLRAPGPVLRRIDDVGARPEHGERRAARRQRAAMRRGIDAARQTADDDDAASGEIGGQTLGHGQRVRRTRRAIRRSRRPAVAARRDCRAPTAPAADRRSRRAPRDRRIAPRHQHDVAIRRPGERRPRARDRSAGGSTRRTGGRSRDHALQDVARRFARAQQCRRRCHQERWAGATTRRDRRIRTGCDMTAPSFQCARPPGWQRNRAKAIDGRRATCRARPPDIIIRDRSADRGRIDHIS